MAAGYTSSTARGGLFNQVGGADSLADINYLQLPDGTAIGVVAGIAAEVVIVAGVATDVTAVSGISADVVAVAADAVDIGVVSGISTDVTSVSGISANVTTVAGISAAVTSVSGISANVTTVAGISADVATVAADAVDIGVVSGISADVTTVAADTVDIGIVSTNIASVNSAATNMAAIIAAPTEAANAAASAAAAEVAKIEWQGAYSAVTAYAINDAVSYLSSSYIATAAGTGNAPTDTLFWDLLAEKGVDGAGDLTSTNNLSDLANIATARTNLGLGTAATTASTDYATAAQGTTADAALPKAGGAMTGAITTTSTFDGRNVATDGAKLDGIEALADVTDVTNVTAAGALMDSEVDVNIKTFVLPASTTISAFGASVIDDADAATARTTLDVDQAGEALALAIALG